jgi:O-antigen ligase
MSNYETLRNPRKPKPESDPFSFPETLRRISNAELPAPPELPVGPKLEDRTTPRRGKKDKREEAETHFVLKRGHTITFIGLLLFTIFVYFRPYEFSTSLTFLQSGAKWIAGFTLLVYLPVQLGMEGNLTIRTREVNLILLLTLTAFLSLIGAINIGEAWENLVEFLKVFAMFLVMVNVVRTEGRLRIMFWVVLAVSITTSIGAISDYQAGRLLEGGARIKGSIGGLFENPNDLALHLVTIVPLAIGLMLESRGIFKKILYLASAALMVSAIIATFSRGGFLGLVAVALTLAWKFGRKNRPLVIVASVIVIVSVMALAPGEYSARLSTIWGGDAMGSSSARQEVFWRSVLVAARYPIFGVGIGNFHFRSIHEQVSHNAYTQVAAELGIAALVIYVLFLINPLKRLRKIERATVNVKEAYKFYYLSVGLQASIIGYMVSSFFASVAFLWYAYYLVAFAICLRRLYLLSPYNNLATEDSPVESSLQKNPVLQS